MSQKDIMRNQNMTIFWLLWFTPWTGLRRPNDFKNSLFLPLELWIRKLILGCFFCILPRRHYMNCCLPWPPEGQARNASHAWSLWSSLMQPSTCCPSQMCHVSGPSSIFLYAVLNILGITPFLHSSTKRCLPLVQRGSSFQCFLLTFLCSG